MDDDEIIIGVNVKKDSNSKNKKKKSKNKDKKKTNKKNNNKKSPSKNRANTAIKEKNRTQIAKTIILIILVIIILVFLLSSSLFNIKTINVTGNTNISSEKIISLSSLELYTNIFKFRKSDIIDKIKENAYIESVTITRKYPNTVNIEIEEREAKYMLQFADSYVYINNQGYMLEISNDKLELPIIVGFTTDLSNIKAGNRLNVDDLKKLNVVLQISQLAEDSGLGGLITKVDISNEKDYVIEMENEGKTVYLGDCSDFYDLKTRMLYLQTILEKVSGKTGEIYLDIDLNTENIRFKETIQ